jgi:hypothetical protein
MNFSKEIIVLNVHEIDELFKLEDARKEISIKVKAMYDYPVNVGRDMGNIKRVHAFFAELKTLLAEETKAVENMEQFLAKMIDKYS